MSFELRVYFIIGVLVLPTLLGGAIYAETTRTMPAYIERANGSRKPLIGRLMYSPGDWWKTGEPSTGGTTFVWPTDTQAMMYAAGELQAIPVVFKEARCLIGRHYTPYRYMALR